MKNPEIAEIFQRIAQILEIKGENVFRIRAYERAAQSIGGLGEDIAAYAQEERLEEIPGIGKDLSERIKEYLQSGKIKLYEDLKKSVPEGVLTLLDIPSVGPKTAKLLYEKLKIKNIAGLKKAIAGNKLNGIFGIKEKTKENILRGIEIVRQGQERMTLSQAMHLAEEFTLPLKKLPEAKQVSVAGSLRRCKETVRDIDILVASAKPEKVVEGFLKNPLVEDVTARGDTKASVRTKQAAQVDCRVVKERSFGAALVYFTGSKDFNIKLRQIAIKKGLKVNEYGIFSATKRGGSAKSFGGRKDKFITGRNEEEFFKALGLAYIEPELREDTGEIELAKKDRLPQLLELKDIRGDLHTHSEWSDGVYPIKDMAEAAAKLGYSYIAVTDHSQSLRVAGGLDTKDLKSKKKQIEMINKAANDFRVLYGTEADIDFQGKIDYEDDVLKEFDIVVAAIHTGFKQSRQQLTRRMVSACKNKYVHIISHPTARLWGVRQPYDIDLEEVFKAAADTNTTLEINAFPQRLDLNSQNARRAKELGVRFAINSDSHSIEQLNSMKLGVSIARRGWLGQKDVINTLPAERLLKEIRK